MLGVIERYVEDVEDDDRGAYVRGPRILLAC